MSILYHYCSNKNFHSIIESHSVWLSSLSLSNDSKEGKLVAEILTRLANEDGLDELTKQRLQQSAIRLEGIIDGLGFCLSEKGDLLSQWRGYADDASGVSIGFSKEYLDEVDRTIKDQNKAGFTLQKIEYEIQEQIKLIKPTYTEIKELIVKGAYKNTGLRGLMDSRNKDEIAKDDEETFKIFSDLSVTVLTLFSKLFLLKSPAFREECEWRLISYFVKSGDDNCQFRASNDRIIPYREYKLPVLKHNSIEEIILGPKNLTPDYVVESFMQKNGFKDTKILHSTASYR